MKISTMEQLKRWRFNWPKTGAGPWSLSKDSVNSAFAQNRSAIGVYWIGPGSIVNPLSFQPKYCGKAVRQSLCTRLNQHVANSSNRHIREYLASERLPRLLFRFIELGDPGLANLLEGLEIAAFRDEYCWNSRNEWTQHWAMDDR